MAMVKLSGMITEIEGKVGGNVWRSDVCGSHIQALPTPRRKEPSPQQKDRQKAFRFLITITKRCFTVEIAAYWQDHANRHPRTNKKGETYTLTWFQMFICHNINKVVAGEDPDLLPPGYELIKPIPKWCEQFA